MNILVLTLALPQPTWGAGMRNYHLLQALSRQHTVSVLALVSEDGHSPDRAVHLLPFVRTVRQVALPPRRGKRIRQIRALATGRSYYVAMHTLPAAQAVLYEELHNQTYDAVLFEGLFVSDYHVPPSVRVILDEHNIEHELVRRIYQGTNSLVRRCFNWIEFRRLRPVELACCRRADLVLLTSEPDRAALHTLLPQKRLAMVPNGVDLQAFSAGAWAETEVPGRIVFTAAFDYYPNIQGALYFAQHCWPLVRQAVPTATWYLVGRYPPAEIQRLASLPGVTVTGAVPAVQPYLAAAQVAAVPLLTGGGTRLKILEALAMRRAVVTTRVGYEGIDCVPDEHLVVADDPAGFAQAVIGLLKDANRRTSLGHAGRKLVEDSYSWEYSGNQLLAALDEATRKDWHM